MLLIQTLAKNAISENSSPLVPLYILTRLPHDTTQETGYNKILGKCKDPDITKWPHYGKNKMRHVLSLDLKTMPQLSFSFLENTDIVSVFISSLSENEAYSSDTDESCVVLSRHDDRNPINLTKLTNSFNVETTYIEVPEDIFDEDFYDIFDKDSHMGILHKELFNTSYVGGKPIWYQGEEYSSETFICQFDERFIEEINLGGDGIMYVFEQTAFWQCG